MILPADAGRLAEDATVVAEVRVVVHGDLAGMAHAVVRVFSTPFCKLQLCEPVTRSRLSRRLPAVAGLVLSGFREPMPAPLSNGFCGFLTRHRDGNHGPQRSQRYLTWIKLS